MREPMRRYAFRVTLAVLWLGAGYYLLFGGVYSVFDIQELRTERRNAVERLDSLIAATDSLVQRGDSLVGDSLAIERTAREEYGLIRDGEVLVRFRPAAEEDEGSQAESPPRELDE
jgi:cell division protein FtsB